MRLFFVNDFFDLLFPRSCALCKRPLFDSELSLCSICIEMLPVTSYHFRPSTNDLMYKIDGLTKVSCAMAYLKFTKRGKSQRILHEIKYRNNPDLALELGQLYGKVLAESGYRGRWDCIVPVPLHPLKQRRRGYNQSQKFGEGIGRLMGLRVVNAMKRIRFTETQTNKTRLKRMDNVAGVFEVSDRPSIENKSILLVDDVMTTGATLIACSNVLLSNGAKKVDLVALAAGS